MANNFAHIVDVAESGSHGDLLRDGRQFLQPCTPPPQGRLPLDVMPNLRSLHWLRTVWTWLPDTSPPTTTQNRRSCETLSARRESSSPISNCWVEEKCNNTNDCSKHEKTKLFLWYALTRGGSTRLHHADDIPLLGGRQMQPHRRLLDPGEKQLAAHRTIATKAEQLAWRQ